MHLTYYGSEQHAKAEEVLHRELELTQKYDRNGLTIGSILQKLGDACQRQSKHGGAIELYEQALTSNDVWFTQIFNARRFRRPDNPGGRKSMQATRLGIRAYLHLQQARS